MFFSQQIGSGTCGQVYICMHKASGEQYAVKVIDTAKFQMLPGVSIQELKEEANLLKQLNHVSLIHLTTSTH